MIFLGQLGPWSGVKVIEHLALFSPMIALVCTMLAVVACPIVLGRSTRTVMTVVAVGLVATVVCIFRAWALVSESGVSGLSTDPGAGILIADNLSVGFQLILIGFLTGVLCLWWIGSSETERNAPEFFILLLGSALGMALMVSTSNLLMIIIAIEIASLPSYAIVGFDKNNRLAAEASLKYMIFGAVCAAIMMYGASLLYGLVGSLSVTAIAVYTANTFAIGDNRLLLGVALLCFLVGIGFKISAVPFHFWCPDAFEGARVEVTTWLSVASKAAGLVLLMRLVLTFCSAIPASTQMSTLVPLSWTLGILAAVTCTVGNFSAYRQNSVKRMLAYSSIAHAGYMMMAAAVFLHPSVSEHTVGLNALMIYIIIYVFMNLGAFGVTAQVVWDTGSDSIESFNGLWRRSPGLALPMICCLVSLVGIPPLAGFLGKWWILVALGRLSEIGSSLGWILIVVLSLNTLISLYYYMRIVVKMVMHDDARPPVRASIPGIALVNLCAVVLLALFIFAQPLKTRTEALSRHLYATVAATLSAGDVVAIKDGGAQ